jgi:hypothetical protein
MELSCSRGATSGVGGMDRQRREQRWWGDATSTKVNCVFEVVTVRPCLLLARLTVEDDHEGRDRRTNRVRFGDDSEGRDPSGGGG